MQTFQCNKCDFRSGNEKSFSRIQFFLAEITPLKKKNPHHLTEEFDEKERMLDESEFVNAGLKEPDDVLYEKAVTIHLCPKHTIWFNDLFFKDLKKRRLIKSK